MRKNECAFQGIAQMDPAHIFLSLIVTNTDIAQSFINSLQIKDIISLLLALGPVNMPTNIPGCPSNDECAKRAGGIDLRDVSECIYLATLRAYETRNIIIPTSARRNTPRIPRGYRIIKGHSHYLYGMPCEIILSHSVSWEKINDSLRKDANKIAIAPDCIIDGFETIINTPAKKRWASPIMYRFDKLLHTPIVHMRDNAMKSVFIDTADPIILGREMSRIDARILDMGYTVIHGGSCNIITHGNPIRTFSVNVAHRCSPHLDEGHHIKFYVGDIPSYISALIGSSILVAPIDNKFYVADAQGVLRLLSDHTKGLLAAI